METTFSELIVDKKKKSEWRESIFTVTINTNKSFNSKDENVQNKLAEMKIKFRQFLEGMFKHSNIPKFIIDLKKPGTEMPIVDGKIIKGYPVSLNDLKEWSAHVQIESNLENTGNLHAHATIKIVHKTRIQVDTTMIQRVGTKFMGEFLMKKNGEQGHMYVRATGRSTSFVMENYTQSN